MHTAIVWLRRDLRLADNPALTAAAEIANRVIPVFIWSPDEDGAWAPGSAQRWWLHHSLAALDASLRAKGSRLVIRTGDSASVLNDLCRETAAEGVFWNRLYEPLAIARDRRVQTALNQQGLRTRDFNGALLFEPWDLQTGAGGAFRVFTPFWKACHRKAEPTVPASVPPRIGSPQSWPLDETLVSLELLPSVAWYGEMAACWHPGEAGGHDRLERFVADALRDYGGRRDYPGVEGVSCLSPHLHFGEVSPRQAWQAVSSRGAERGMALGAEAFCRELGWREFAHHVLFHHPDTPTAPMDDRFAGFPWRGDHRSLLEAWQRGETGFPIVDAGMRQLWRTGWMHNRVRMIAASLLVKNLRIPWQAGTEWFWDTLVDADLANNTLGWQWAAGCGADAAPFFRIFNPVRQGDRFDPDGHYVRRWIPELASLPNRYIHCPWTLPAAMASELGFAPGRHYPDPVVDLKTSRQEALIAFESVKAVDAGRLDSE